MPLLRVRHGARTPRKFGCEGPQKAARDRGGDDWRNQRDDEEAAEVLGGTGHAVLREDPEHPRVRPELGDVLEDGEGRDRLEQRAGVLRVVEMGDEEYEPKAEENADSHAGETETAAASQQSVFPAGAAAGGCRCTLGVAVGDGRVWRTRSRGVSSGFRRQPERPAWITPS